MIKHYLSGKRTQYSCTIFLLTHYNLVKKVIHQHKPLVKHVREQVLAEANQYSLLQTHELVQHHRTVSNTDVQGGEWQTHQWNAVVEAV